MAVSKDGPQYRFVIPGTSAGTIGTSFLWPSGCVELCSRSVEHGTQYALALVDSTNAYLISYARSK